MASVLNNLVLAKCKYQSSSDIEALHSVEISIQVIEITPNARQLAILL